MKYVSFAIFPVVLVIMAFAPEGLRLWLGPDFARNSGPVLRWLAAGVFVNALAQVPFSMVQGVGRPDISAKLQLAELPFYLLALRLLVNVYGIEGAAMAWARAYEAYARYARLWELSRFAEARNDRLR